jgi:hypothetical protein
MTSCAKQVDYPIGVDATSAYAVLCFRLRQDKLNRTAAPPTRACVVAHIITCINWLRHYAASQKVAGFDSQ